MIKKNSIFIFILKNIVFLILCFFIQRITFLVFNFSAFNSATFTEIIKSFIVGLKLDFSMSAYILLIPLITGSVDSVSNFTWIKKINFIYISIITFLIMLIGIANAALYKEWNCVLNNRALMYLKYPKEIFSSLSSLKIFILFFLLAGQTFFCIYIYKIKINNIEISKSKKIINTVLKSVLIFIILGVMGRGGLQLSPINVSFAYFSNNNIINHFTINPTWYLASDILSSNNENKYQFYTSKQVENNLKNFIYKIEDTTSYLISTKPNIIFIVLESFSANAIGYYGCKENLTPNFDAFAKQGIVFDSIYSSGFRTEQGIINIFSGFPSQPNASIITQTSKAEKLPSLFSDLKNIGYHTSFYYGGEIEFANIGAYLRLNKMDYLSTVKDYSKAQKNSKWGAHDEYLFTKVKSEINTLSQPFFSTMLTLSNHEPFELPNKTTPKEEAQAFKKTIQYTDSCLGDFLNFCKNQKWYSNSLIFIVADHGHRLPYNYSMNAAPSKHIPLLLLGGALKKEYSGISSSKIANQHDIPATLLELLKRNDLSKKYIFSQSILSNNNNYAYFTNENILGWKQKNSSFTYSFLDKKIELDKGNYPDSTTIITAKSFLQKVYSTYLNY